MPAEARPACKCHGVTMLKTPRSWQCRVKKNAADRKLRSKKAEEYSIWFAEVKSAAGCQDCGVDNPIVLCFHHRDPAEKKFPLRPNLCANRLSKDSIQQEMDKCDILCENCHRIRHYNERSS